MKCEKRIEIAVGLFMLAGILALLLLGLKVSGLSLHVKPAGYHVTAQFANVGGLKPRATVSIAGVKIGRVEKITLNPKNYRADVVLAIDAKAVKIPTDSSASILTAGLLGTNYISLVPGFDETFLKDHDRIVDTTQAMILENLIGQLIFNMKDKKTKP